jgi:sugar lactone lactonase YvrE
MIYVSSIAQKKIVKIMPDGSSMDFVREGQDGFLEGLGMKIDAKKGWLWAVSNIRKGNVFTSHIHGFDLASGKTMHQYTITDTIPRLLNDLILDASGILLITDTYHSAVYRYDPGAKHFEVFVQDTTKLKWPNGIDFLDKDNLVIATYGHGLTRLNTQSKEISPLPGYKDHSYAFGMDGLVMHGNHLYGVYNSGKEGYPSNAVVKYTLDEKRQRIISESVIDRGNPAFADPTTAAKSGNKLYVIANSHLDHFNANKESVIGIENKLTPLKLVVYGL